MSAFGGLEPNLAKLSWLLLLLVAVLTPTTFGLHCYKDTNGIKMRNNGEPVDVTHFEKLNCRNMSSGEVEKPCMSKLEKNGIVTRNCATIIKTAEVCEEDSQGSILCYCLTDYCNGSLSLRAANSLSLLAMVLGAIK